MTVKGAMIVPIEARVSQWEWMWFRKKKEVLKAIETFGEASRGHMASAQSARLVTSTYLDPCCSTDRMRVLWG